MKKSPKGLCFVYKNKDGTLTYTDNHSMYDELDNTYENALHTVFINGELHSEYNLDEIRETLHGGHFD